VGLFLTTEEDKMNLDIGSKGKIEKHTFELVVEIKDNEGKPTGVKKSYGTDDAVRLHRFWLRNSGSIKKKRKKADAAQGKDVDAALKEVETHTNKIRQQRKLED